MANPQEDILRHNGVVKSAGKHARDAVLTARMFADNPDLTHIRFWPEDYDAILKALQSHGYRADGFKVGNLKAVRFSERS
jgi:hypothetical protein